MLYLEESGHVFLISIKPFKWVLAQLNITFLIQTIKKNVNFNNLKKNVPVSRYCGYTRVMVFPWCFSDSRTERPPNVS